MSGPRRIGLVGCVKQKRTEPSPAEDLYTSPLFRGRRAYVQRTCARWFILSAEHGLVEPDRVLAYYDSTLNDAPVAHRRAWSARVLDDLDRACGDLKGTVVEIHAGANYRVWGLDAGLRARGAAIEVPTEGLSFGRQLAYYKHGGSA